MALIRRLIIAVFLVGCAPGCLLRTLLPPQSLPAGVRELRDLAYYQGKDFDDQKHRLNLFIPTRPGPHPVVVFVHGGGWFWGDRAQTSDPYSKLGTRLAQRGILTAVISYRLSPRHVHPAHIEDVARAVAWTFEHVDQHGGDRSRIHLMGHSAGAQLVALAACDPTWLGAHGIAPERLAGVIAISGPFDVDHLGRSPITAATPVYPAFGRPVGRWRAVSPRTHLRPGRPLPPFLVAWAAADPDLLRRKGRSFAAALEAHGTRVEIFEAPWRAHFSVITELGRPDDGIGTVVEGFVLSRSPGSTHRAHR